MSQYGAYPAYKDSGVEWLGQVPAHWNVKRLRYTVQLNPTINMNLKLNEEVSFLPMQLIGNDGAINLETTRPVSEVRNGYTYFENGDIAFAKVTPCFENGKGAIMRGLIGGCGFGTTELTVLRSNIDNAAGFINYLLKSDRFRMLGEGAMTGAGGLKRVPDEFTRNFEAAWPNIDEQEDIVKLLDAETTRIDSLITKKTRFIALLREKRQALITHAVTKGLDSDVEMKGSGVEWLGDVPVHWTVKHIKYLADVLRGKFTHRPRNDPAFYDGNFPFIQTGDITSTSRYITSYSQTLNGRGAAVSKEFPKGTLVMTIAANIGDVAILDFAAYFPDSIVGLVPTSEINLMFLFYLMQAMNQLMLATATISTQMNLNIDKIIELTAAQPPLTEQEQIVEYIDRETTRIDTLITKTERSIDLLKERRSALITAAVTGQIDLRTAA